MQVLSGGPAGIIELAVQTLFRYFRCYLWAFDSADMHALKREGCFITVNLFVRAQRHANLHVVGARLS
jgi:hypothetical protein